MENPHPTQAPVSIETYDVLILGGGPAGTATAFRAHELGLRVLVLDHDDLMKRIRDYSKSKLILPSFGGGDEMRFPVGGELVSKLTFGPIDKDELVARWKKIYQEHEIAHRIGLELVELDEREEGGWSVHCWNHRSEQAEVFHGRFVVLALGRGMPRRFDIPGSTEGVAFRLRDARIYVGRPVCVIGGGASAIEAVISIAEAKAAEKDPSAVYWSYRSKKMPRVSKILNDQLDETSERLGNIRHFPESEPLAVIRGTNREDHLTLRVDRRQEGEIVESKHVEFPNRDVLACIGGDLPDRLFQQIGIGVVESDKKKRVVISRHLEAALPGVFVIGDLLSPSYLQIRESGPAEEVKHRGNIKAALRDGVLVAEVLRQKLDGKTEINVEIDDDESAEKPSRKPIVELVATAEYAVPDETAVELRALRRSQIAERPRLVRMLPGGVEGEEFPLPKRAVTSIGRRPDCDIAFTDDTTMSRRHASIEPREDGIYLVDENSTTGVFLKIPARRKLRITTGDVIRVGRQFLLFARRGSHMGFTHYDIKGRDIGQHELEPGTIVLGRQAPDITLDEQDMTLSRRQLAITVEGTRVLVKDLKTVNGSYLRVQKPRRLSHGEQFRVGKQLFAFSERGDVVLEEDGNSSSTNVSLMTDSLKLAAEGAGRPTVTFQNLDQVCPILPGQSICEAAEAAGLPIASECRSGICGSDPIRILSGKENLLSLADEVETETLADLCELKAGEYRLACMCRVKGSIVVDLVDP